MNKIRFDPPLLENEFTIFVSVSFKVVKMMPENKKILVRIAIFSIFFAVFYGWLLPHFDVSNLQSNIISLDLMSSYQSTDVSRLFNQIGIQGMSQYYQFIVVDNFYIVVYCGLTYYILKYLELNTGRLGKIITGVRWIPLLVGSTDFIENINTFILLNRFPEISEKAVKFASAVTTAKWYLAAVLVSLIVCFIFYFILRNVFWKLKQISKQTTDNS